MANKRTIEINGGISPWSNSASYVKYCLKELGSGPVDVDISSYGGDVNEALQIKAAFQQHGDVRVHFIGFNASSATIIGHGAKITDIREDGLYLIHKPSVWVETWGQLNDDQIQAAITELENQKKDAETCTLLIAQDYVNCRGMKLDKVLSLMKEARWLSAKEAKELGLIDEIVPSSAKKIEVSNETVAMCNALGYPVPSNQSEPDTEQIPEKKPTWFTTAIDSILNKNKSPNDSKMKKDYLFINQVLKIDGLEEKESIVTLSLEQCEALNKSMKDKDDELKTVQNDLTTAKNEKKTAEDNLSGVSAKLDELHDEVKHAATIDEKFTKVKNIISRRPGTAAESPASNSIDEQFKDVAVDPVNSFL